MVATNDLQNSVKVEVYLNSVFWRSFIRHLVYWCENVQLLHGWGPTWPHLHPVQECRRLEITPVPVDHQNNRDGFSGQDLARIITNLSLAMIRLPKLFLNLQAVLRLLIEELMRGRHAAREWKSGARWTSTNPGHHSPSTVVRFSKHRAWHCWFLKDLTRFTDDEWLLRNGSWLVHDCH